MGSRLYPNVMAVLLMGVAGLAVVPTGRAIAAEKPAWWKVQAAPPSGEPSKPAKPEKPAKVEKPEPPPPAPKLEIGKPAPDFKLLNQDSKPVALADLKGKWVVLYFYPKDETPGCTTEACEFSDGFAGLEKLGATVLGVSPDSPESHQKFIAKHSLKIMLLSDGNRIAIDSYNAWSEANKRVQRSTVIIDPAGNLAFHWDKVTPKGHAAAVKAKLEELQKPPAAK